MVMQVAIGQEKVEEQTYMKDIMREPNDAGGGAAAAAVAVVVAEAVVADAVVAAVFSAAVSAAFSDIMRAAGRAPARPTRAASEANMTTADEVRGTTRSGTEMGCKVGG